MQSLNNATEILLVLARSEFSSVSQENLEFRETRFAWKSAVMFFDPRTHPKTDATASTTAARASVPVMAPRSTPTM
jgi:hypothetical protein